jgi:hypothetical protein
MAEDVLKRVSALLARPRKTAGLSFTFFSAFPPHVIAIIQAFIIRTLINDDLRT